MARCGCGAAGCGCSVVSGTGTTVTGSGSAANPFVVNAVTNCAEVRACLSAGNGISYNPATGVISARPSADAGNNLVIGSDGGLYTPTGAATVTAGCGLTGNGSAGNPIRANTATWPFTCDVEDQAGGVYCDANGLLRSEPPVKSNFQQATLGQNFPGNPIIPVGEADQVIGSLDITITNPDPCRNANVILFQEADVDLNFPPNSAGGYGIDTDDMTFFQNSTASTILRQHVQVSKLTNLVLTPGQVLVHTMEITANRGAGGAYYTRIQGTLRAWVISTA